ncbi:MAG: MFS transporter [Gemmatimonadota bacterium]|nr:MFS transporter [Gemmatimonadota bacterium]
MTEAIGQREELKRLSVLIAASGVDMIGFAIVLPLLPFYALEHNASPLQIGLLISAFSVAQLVFAPVWGWVSDRYGRRPALLIGLSSAAAAYLVFAFADTLLLLFLSRLVQGAGGGTTAVAHAYVADTIAPKRRARALGWLSAATAVGIMIGPVIGSFASRWGQAAPGLVAASLCLLNIIFAWRWLPESRVLDPSAPPKQRTPVLRATLQVIARPGSPVPRLIWIYAAGMLGFSSMTAALTLYLEADFGVTTESIGYVFLYMGALSLIMRSLLLGPIVTWLGERGTMRSGTVLLTIGLLLLPWPGGILSLALILALVPIGTALLFPATTSLISQSTSRDELGMTMGVAQTFAGLSRVIAPLVATWSFGAVTHGAPFIIAGVIVAGVGVLAFRSTDHPAPDPVHEGLA